MSGRFRRRGWRSSRFVGRRSFRNGFRRSNMSSRSRGNLRAANQQSDTSDVVINLMTKCKAGVTAFRTSELIGQAPAGTYYPGTAVLNIYDLLRKSEFFDSYKNMYDQFRITSIKVKVTPVSWKTYDQFNIPTGNDNAPGMPADAANNAFDYPQAITVVTAWDRTGLDDVQLLSFGGGVCYTNIGDNITTYSSAKSQQLVGGATFNCTRYLYPSSAQEKSLYLSTNDLKPQLEYANNGLQNYMELTPVAGGPGINRDIITNLWSSPNCPFKPTFMVGILAVDKPTTGAGANEVTFNGTTHQINPVTFNLEFDIGVTFRVLRKAQVV